MSPCLRINHPDLTYPASCAAQASSPYLGCAISMLLAKGGKPRHMGRGLSQVPCGWCCRQLSSVIA
jgi:hypothetical protein